MKSILRRRSIPLLAATLLLVGGASAQAGCLNTSSYPSSAVIPNSNGTVTEISTCNWPQEYASIGSVLAGANYEFTISPDGYMTVRSGTFDGPVLGQGASPLQVTTVTNDDLFVHYTLDANCQTGSSGCRTTTVQILLDCTLPTVSFTVEPDCDNQQFFVSVDVTALGDAPTVDIENNGTAASITGVGVGTYVVGPFPELVGVQIFVRHNGDVLCSVQSPVLVNVPCPVVGCGPNEYTYCFGNEENQLFFYSSGNAFPLATQFLGGTFDLFGDELTIYNGPDVNSPVLFQGNNNGDMAGVIAISNNPDNALTFQLVTSFSNSCQDGVHQALQWEVLCLECLQAEATYSVVSDCDNFQYFVDVNVTDLGSSNLLGIVNNQNADVVTANAVGVYQAGPFVSGQPVIITLANDQDDLCNVSSDVLVNDLCSQPIVCGAPAVQTTYCYVANDNTAWSYSSVGAGTLRLTFLRGTIESSSYDRISIYDGPNNTSPLLFAHTNASTWNLGPVGSGVLTTSTNFYGVEVFSTSGSLYMEMESEASVQCATSTNFDPWEWDVVCLDCTLPIVGASVVDDCENNAFSIPVTIASTGDGATVNIVYSVNGASPEVIVGVAVGQTLIGPFSINDVVNVVVEHESNALCNVNLGNLTDTGTCPTLVICGTELNVTHCPANSANDIFYYEGTGAFPLALLFNSGTLESCCDRLYVYDGPDENSPLLTPVAGVGGPVAGLFFSASNPQNRLTVRVTTDGSGSCASGGYDPLDWTLSCLDCVPPAATFVVVQDCENFQYFVDVVVTSLGSDDEIELVYSAGTGTLAITAPGTYQVGPFVSGVPNQFTLVNDANSLCNLASPTLVNPLCPQILCGASVLEETYCYVPSDSKAWAYQLPSPGTLRLTFLRGTIESNSWDRIRIYDGPSNTSPLLFTHNTGTTMNLGPTGSAVNGTGYNYYGVDVTATGSNLYMEMESDPSVSCTSSSNFDQWDWIVFCEGCQIPGVTYTVVPSCVDRSYTTEVAASSVGTAGLSVLNTITGETQTATAAGTLTFGPYDVDELSVFELIDLETPACSYFSDTLTYTSDDCIIVSCGVDNYDYCYGNDEDRWYTFQAAQSVPITISFMQGQMLTGDRIALYNGRDENAPVIFQGNNGGNLTGLAVNSTNATNTLTLRVQSNGAGSCETGESTLPLRWDVACGAVGINELAQAGFMAFPNPTTGLLTLDLGADALGNVNAKLYDQSGRVVMEEQFAAQGGVHTMDIGGLTSGQYMLQIATSDKLMSQRVQLMR